MGRMSKKTRATPSRRTRKTRSESRPQVHAFRLLNASLTWVSNARKIQCTNLHAKKPPLISWTRPCSVPYQGTEALVLPAAPGLPGTAFPSSSGTTIRTFFPPLMLLPVAPNPIVPCPLPLELPPTMARAPWTALLSATYRSSLLTLSALLPCPILSTISSLLVPDTQSHKHPMVGQAPSLAASLHQTRKQPAWPPCPHSWHHPHKSGFSCGLPELLFQGVLCRFAGSGVGLSSGPAP